MIKFDPIQSESVILNFLKSVLKSTGIKKIVIGVSGGIDSATSLYLISKVLPPENIFIAHLYYYHSHKNLITPMLKTLKIPPENQYILSIKKSVDALADLFQLPNSSFQIPTSHFHLPDKLRLGNIMARVRMITLFDLAKKYDALVCGTENKSEHLLGYFTRFGDAASDIEPITQLYKTQVYQLAKYLKVPEDIIQAKPSAGLWGDQTDEGEFGFTYREADQVLHLYFDKKIPLKDILRKDFPNAEKIISFALKNSFKLKVPYSL